MPLYTFVIYAPGVPERSCLGDALSINKEGLLRIRLQGKLVGVAKATHWTRVMLLTIHEEAAKA